MRFGGEACGGACRRRGTGCTKRMVVVGGGVLRMNWEGGPMCLARALWLARTRLPRRAIGIRVIDGIKLVDQYPGLCEVIRWDAVAESGIEHVDERARSVVWRRR